MIDITAVHGLLILLCVPSISPEKNVHPVGRSGSVVQWLEHASDYRVIMGLNPSEAASKLWQFP